jgi:hypothetical protein
MTKEKASSPRSRVDDATTGGAIIKTGMLDKRAGSLHFSIRHHFTKRFFVLRERSLVYYKNEQSYANGNKPDGYVPVDFMLSAREVDDAAVGDESLKWKLVSSARTIELMSQSLEDKADWFVCIGEVVDAKLRKRMLVVSV